MGQANHALDFLRKFPRMMLNGISSDFAFVGYRPWDHTSWFCVFLNTHLLLLQGTFLLLSAWLRLSVCIELVSVHVIRS